MSRVLFFNVDLHGHVNPTLGLIKKLIQEGEEVVYYTGDVFRERIEETGAVFRSYRDQVGFGTYDGGGIDAFFITADFILGRSKVIVEEFLEEVTEWKPDYIIHDSFCYWGKEFARILGIPGVSVFANFAFIDEMGLMDPSYFMENVLRTGNDPVYLMHKTDGNLYRKMMSKLTRVIAMKYGLKDINIINDIFCSKEKLSIMFTSRAFQIYEEAFDDSYCFTGFSVYPRKESDDFPYDWLNGKPIVYIALGTIFNNKSDFYLQCIEAFRDSDRQVVMAVGHNTKMDDWGDTPDNFIIMASVPQLELLKRAEVFISHGGTNSVHESICMHVPLVIVPQSFDQFMGAIAVERSGAGRYIRSADIRAAELLEAVNEVTVNPTYRDRCIAIHRSFEEAGGAERAVEHIFAHVKKEVTKP